MEKYFKVGQTVYCAFYGEGVVKSINPDKRYPLEVQFFGENQYYTLDGRVYSNAEITLSQNPIPRIVNVPLVEEEEFKKGDIVFVRDTMDSDWKVSFFVRHEPQKNGYQYGVSGELNGLLTYWMYCTKKNPYQNG